MELLHELIFILWPLALVLIFGFGFIFRQRGLRATIGAGLPSFLLFGMVLLGEMGTMASDPATEWKSTLEIVLGIVMLIGVGFREEVLYRGVVTNAIARKYANSTKGLWITVLSAGAMFGAIHLANAFNNISFSGALAQALGSVGSGIFFCAVYLRGGSIWGMALLHALMDASGAAGVLFTNNAGDLSSLISGYGFGLQEAIYIVIDLLVAAFLLRKSKRQKIYDRFQQLNSLEEANS
jgi:membrane protease YdiL (CAAX protease family)